MSILILIPIILGLLAGYLINYLADVLPLTRKFSQPQCLNCKEKRSWADYLLFRPCTNCTKGRNFRTFTVLLILPVLSSLLWLFPGRHGTPFFLEFVLLIYLLTVLVIDIEYKVILHPVSIFGAFLAFGVGIYLHGKESIQTGLVTSLIGGVVGFAIMLVFYFMGEMFVKRMAKKRGMPADEVALGFGDVNLSGILGLLLGWELAITCLFFAILAGGLISLLIIIGMLITKKYKAFTAIPYAPFLIISALFFLTYLR